MPSPMGHPEDLAANAMSRSQRLGITVTLMVTITFAYVVVGYSSMDTPLMVVPTFADAWIPFNTNWILPYIFMYVQAWVPACAVADKRVLIRWAMAISLMYAFAIPIWVLYTVHVPRLPLVDGPFFVYLLTIIRSIDPPTNCLPSMHVAVATLGALVTRRVDKWIGTALIAFIPFIWYSTVAVGQHWAIDGAVGLLFAGVAYSLAFKFKPLPASAFTRIERMWHTAWWGPFVFCFIGLWFRWMWFE